MIIWRPLNPQPRNQQQSNPNSSQKGKQATVTGSATIASEGDPSRPRTLWLRIHPTMFNDVSRELQKATSQVLDRPRTSTEEIEVEIADLRGQVNAFEIMGPKSSQVLKGALSPVSKDDREEFKKVLFFSICRHKIADWHCSFGSPYQTCKHLVQSPTARSLDSRRLTRG